MSNHPLSKRTYNILHSIRFKLALWFVIILAIVMLVFSAFIILRQVQEIRQAALARLELKARRLGILIRQGGPAPFGRQGGPGGLGGQIPDSPFENSAFLEDEDVLALVNLQNQVIQKLGPAEDNTILQLVNAHNSGHDLSNSLSSSIFFTPFNNGTNNQSYAFVSAPVMVNEQLGGYVILGTPLDPNNQLSRLFISLGLGMLITLTIALVGGFWLADRAMRPVKTITHTARSISDSDLNQRINLDQDDEIGELADTFDDMLTRLQAAFERQRQFTADASHELRTPLTIVELEAGRALAATRTPQEYARVLQVIQSENHFMTRLVNNLLTLARMDSGQVILNMEKLDLSDITLEAVERLEPLARKDNVVLKTGELPELPVQGDHQFLTRMLTNLIENAIKYSTGDEKTVIVNTGVYDTDKTNQAWVRISDNGPGISAEHITHLFDRFYQVDKSRTKTDDEDSSISEKEPSGAGLGLSIAQWIAQAHDGDIHVESTVGVGTTFEVSLPLATTG